MKFNKSLIIFSFLLVVLLCINSAAASEGVDIEDNSSDDSTILKIEAEDENDLTDDELAVSNNESVLCEPKTIHVEEVDENTMK